MASPPVADLAVQVRGLRKSYGAQTVLDGVDLDIRRGEFFALLGPSGTGKTTLLRVLAGLETPDAGEVWVPPRRTTVYQEPRLVPARRVLANVTIGQPRGAATRQAGLRALAEVDSSVPRRDAVAGYLHERAGNLGDAAHSYAAAARRAQNVAERDHLTKQAARLNAALARTGQVAERDRSG